MSPDTSLACLILLGLASTAGGQDAATRPAQQLQARVVRVAGRAYWAPVGVSPTDADAWRPVHVNDRYAAGTQIKTSLRSAVVLVFGDDTVVKIERMTLASIAQFYRSATTKTTRIGLGYGAVRAGVAEGVLRSDFVIDSPVATLSKRGTDGIYFFLEPRTGRFEISLARPGELAILHKISHQIRHLRRGERLTHLLLDFILRARLDRNFNFFATRLPQGETRLQLRLGTGLVILDPGAGPSVLNRAGKDNPILQAARITQVRRLARRLFAPLGPVNLLLRPEGFFGTNLTEIALPSARRAPARRR